MKQATHFIEVYQGLDPDSIWQTAPEIIENFDIYLRSTADAGLETIAIFKIYPKQPLAQGH